MKKISKFIFYMVLITSFILTGCTFSKHIPVINNNGVFTFDISTDLDLLYTKDIQDQIHNEIEFMKNKESFSLKDPLILANPYGTNTTGLYIYFKTSKKASISYKVSADGYDDFQGTLAQTDSREHEGSVIGIIPDTKNKITLYAYDEDGSLIDSYAFEYDAPSLMGSSENLSLQVNAGTSTEKLSDGLYAMLGNRSEENNEEVGFILLYDNDGILRSEIPVKSYRACNILFKDNLMYFSTSSSQIIGMDATGYIQKFYDLDEYNLHHDYTFGSSNDMLVLATKKGESTIEDQIIQIDLKSGNVTNMIDLRKLLSKYFDTLNVNEEDFDWVHVNSIRMFDTDSIIISSRETSTIIKIDDIYTNPTIAYMIGSSSFWQESGYDNLVLEQIGDFSLNAGQHCVEIEKDESLSEGQYYLYFFNNNNAVISTRDYDYSQDRLYEDALNEEKNSYYETYLVDESNRTFTLIEQIAVEYSGYVSSAQNYEDNKIIDSGQSFTVVELDSNNEVIQTMVGNGSTWWYRVFKYDFKDFWFAG